MKKTFNLLLMLVIAVMLLSCEKEEKNPTTFTVVNNSEYFESTIDYFDGSMYEVIIFLYVGDDVAGQENIKKITYGGGTTEQIEVEERIEKVRVSFKFLPEESEFFDLELNYRKYTVSYFFLNKEQNTEIIIDASTMITGTPT